MISPDPRNKLVKSYVDGQFVDQYQPALPLYDAGFLHGKLVWSSPRLIQGRIFRLPDHLAKIRGAAELNHFPSIPDDAAIVAAIRQTLILNKMFDGVHVRIALSAGNQVTASMDLAAIIDWQGEVSPPRIVIMPEYRDNVYDATRGITLMTSSYKRPLPDTVDQVSHDNNQNASSRALFEAKQRQKTSSLMYDPDGFLAEAPASHAAIIKDGALYTPFVRCCPPGVTRRVILELCAEQGIPAQEADLTPEQVSQADEIMLLGTMSGPVGVIELDDRQVGKGGIGPLTRKLSAAYERALGDPVHGYDIGLGS